MRSKAAVVMCLAIGIASPALAQEVGEEDRAEARAAYLRGKAHHDAGEYEQAVGAYEQAQELDPRPAMLFNIAQVYRLWGERDGDLELKRKALAHYKSYLAAEPEGRAAPEAYGHVTALEAELKAAEESAAARREKEEAQRQRLEERRKAQEERRRRRLEEARERSRRLRLSRRYRIAGLASAGAGLLFTAVGAKFHLDARDREERIESAQGSWSAELDRALKKGRSAETTAVVFYSLGAAAVVGGGVVYLLGWQERPEGAPGGWLVTPSADHDSVGFAFSGSF